MSRRKSTVPPDDDIPGMSATGPVACALEEAATKGTHGGARPGAGRKPTGNAGVMVPVRVSARAAQIARERGGAWLTALIEGADELAAASGR